MAAGQNITVDKSKELQQKTLAQLSPDERATMASIRDAVPKPTADTVMQKVVPISDLGNYVNGSYKVRGCVTEAADSKHLKTFDDIYHGERLDYTGSKFTGADKCAVIRYRADNSGAVALPSDEKNPDPYPFTNHGFTSGDNDTLGVPEWRMGKNSDMTEGEIWIVDSNGSESLYAVYNDGTKGFDVV